MPCPATSQVIKEDRPMSTTMRNYLEDQSWSSNQNHSTSSGVTQSTFPGEFAMNNSPLLNYPCAKNNCFKRKNSLDEDHVSSSSEKKKMNKKKRVIKKGGLTSVTYKSISKKRRRYISDLYTTLLDSSWSYCVLMFTASFYISWLLFALIYYIISYTHGDLLENNQNNSNWTSCILEIDGFSSCFLFSLETQHTIGYGTRQTTTECLDAMLVVSFQVMMQFLKTLTFPSSVSFRLSYSSIHGWFGLLQTISSPIKNQDCYLQPPCSYHFKEQETVFDIQNWGFER